MIKSDCKKKILEMEGTKINIMTELTMIIHELFIEKDLTDDEINLCVKLGMCKNDKKALLDVMLEQIIERMKKQMEE